MPLCAGMLTSSEFRTLLLLKLLVVRLQDEAGSFMEKELLGTGSLSMIGQPTHCKRWGGLCWIYTPSSIYPSIFSPGDGLKDMCTIHSGSALQKHVYTIVLP